MLIANVAELVNVDQGHVDTHLVNLVRLLVISSIEAG